MYDEAHSEVYGGAHGEVADEVYNEAHGEVYGAAHGAAHSGVAGGAADGAAGGRRIATEEMIEKVIDFDLQLLAISQSFSDSAAMVVMEKDDLEGLVVGVVRHDDVVATM